LAEQEYQKTVGFIGEKWNITTKDQLREIIKMFDNSGKKNNPQADKTKSVVTK